MEQQQAEQIIEALLFASNRPLTCAQIKEVLEELDTGVIKALITRLNQEYINSQRSFSIKELAGGYQISTEPEYAPWLKKLYQRSRKEKLSHPSLETVAIIAYRQPVTRQEVEDIRGVNVEAVLKNLMEKSLVRISGRKQIPGRPFLYGTTRQFLEFFGLQSLQDLPKIEELKEAVPVEAAEKGSTELLENNWLLTPEVSGGEKDGEAEQISQENRPD